MLSKRVVVLIVSLAFLLGVVPSAMFGQAANTGTVAGTVTDPTGAAVVDARVTLADPTIGSSRTATTNETGRYIFANVVPGTYSVTINKSGFRQAKFSDQVVNVGTALTLNVALELGSTTEVVEVTATGAELQSLNATVGNTVSGDLLQSMPTIGRDSSTFVTLQPGVSPDGSVAGAVVDQSTFLLDGGQNTNDMDGSMQVYTPSFGGDPTGGIVSNSIGGAPTGVMPTPLDSIEEFKVNTANQTADFNSSAGAQVQVVTKRGTNTWHGTAYEYYLDNNWNANSWDNNATTPRTPQPSYHYNRAGLAGGGPIIPKSVLGGKTYFFGNFEGFWWPNSATIQRVVPTANMRAGILEFGGVQYHLGNAATADPTGSNCGPLGTALCDPRQIGVNSLVQQMWAKMPLPNEGTTSTGAFKCGAFAGSSKCDGFNEGGFIGNLSEPYTSHFAVGRLDHDFGAKWHFNSSYRYYRLDRTTSSQTDITNGKPVSLSNRPQQPWYLVAGLTTNITSNTTNDFHFSYLRNYWAWNAFGGPPQFSQLGGALEPFGESATTVLAPYNVNTQNVRTRFWDGQDKFFRDDITMLKGNHLFTFGGAYQRNYNYHQRSDNGGGINYTPTYQLGESGTPGGGLVDFSSTKPAGVSSSTWGRDVSGVLGIVSDSQVAYTRSGANLALNPPLTHAFDQSTIPYYNVYWSDSWHMKPSFTLTYGLGWTLEMPPTEKFGKQIEVVDEAGQQLDLMAYINAKKAAALKGEVYNPTVGFALVGNTGGGQKYPYQPYYGSFSPRVAAAWNPNMREGFLGKMFGGNRSVIRGGYSRVYGRLNGVDLVLVPLLGTGLIQPVKCRANWMPIPIAQNGTGAATCGTPNAEFYPSNNPTVAQAFRVGTDGNNAPIPGASATLPQPTFPGINSVSAGAGEGLDAHFRPNVVDSFDFTIQRQLSNKILLELGYIGRRITHEYQPVNINAVPYMMTKGGQTFAKAYAAIETSLGCATSYNACGAAIPEKTIKVGGVTTPNPAYTAYFNALPSQAFFTSALTTGACTGSYAGIAFTSCTAAVAFNEVGNFLGQNVWDLWSDLDNGAFNFPRSMLNTPLNCPTGTEIGCNGQLSSGVGLNASIGHGNYNGGFVSLKVTNWHNVTLQQNFTYSKALGTGAFVQATSEYTPNDPFNIDNMYGVQNFDRKFVYNVYALIEDPYFKGQHGAIGRLLGGWTIAPILAAGSGAPVYCGTNTDAQSFGAADGADFFNNEQCIFTGAHPYGSSLHSNAVQGSFNIFKDPAGLFNTIRNPILGLDNGTGGVGAIRGQPYWNMDVRVTKNVKVYERASFEFQFVVTNVFNHPVFFDPTLDPTAFDSTNPGGSFGTISSQGNNPRALQFGIRFSF